MEKYNILEELGIGTYGVVVKAVNTKNNELVAIKKMKKKYTSWDECLNLPEIKALIAMKHPNIVKMKELILAKEELNLIFEFVGNNLYEYMTKNTRELSELQIRNIMFQVLQGLSHMHKKDLFHRDIKPENILINQDCVKIADFGLVKESKMRSPYTDYVATRWYRAPEVILKCKIYNFSIDIFALGAIMAELYNKKPLLPGKSEFDQMGKICEILGTPKESEWPDGYSLASRINYKFPICKGQKLSTLIPKANDLAINLIESMLNLNPLKRPTASQCLQHPFFQCNDLLSLYGIKLNNSLITSKSSNNNMLNPIRILSGSSNKKSSMNTIFNSKKNTLPKLELISLNTNSHNNPNSNNNRNSNMKEKSSSSTIVSKANKSKVDEFMTNFFNN